MSILDYLIPQTMEHQRNLARQRFGATVQQPQMFNMENAVITPQARSDYERGYGIPYPKQQVPSPTAGLEGGGMTYDPNRQTTIQPPENLPVEYVQPRTAEDMAIREGTISGQQSGAAIASETDYLRGKLKDIGDEDDYEVPSYGKWSRKETPETASDDPLVEVPGIGKLPASVAWRYMKDDKTQDKDVMVDPDGPEGPLPSMPSQHAYHYMNQGAGKMSPHVQQALDYFTAMAKQTGLDPKDAILLAWKPELKEMIQRDMDEQAKAMYDLMASIIMNEFQGYYDQQIGGNQDPMGIR